jgi:chaperone required for assembly of F1-ATPase
MEEYAQSMRRFWKEVTTEQSAYGLAIRLDGKPVKTPLRAELTVPTQMLADAVISEWEAVEEKIDPAAMPMTGFANAAIDRIGPERATFVDAISAYGETDLFCYRAEQGEPLAVRQAEVWEPWLEWARARYGVVFNVVEGIMPQPQPADTVERLKAAVTSRGTFELAAMAKLAHLSGSLVATLALVERAGTARELWNASCLDEIWQEELWGEDYFATKNRNDREAEFMQAARFLELLRSNA